jgi:TolB-like protein/Tfp pilus assembly protein PilF
MSEVVRQSIGSMLDLNLEDLGEHQVKNIARAVHVFRVRFATDEAGPKQPGPGAEERLAIPHKPSIAVLPFSNMSGDPDQEFFSDGITEDIITALSKIRWFFVIARNTTFSYKGQPVDVNQVAEELGVRYVLEGSVRRVGNEVRINTQLIDATTGGHLWAERYDRELNDIFALQDEITKNIVAELEVNLTEEEREPSRYTADLGAYDLFLRGREYQLLRTKEANSQAKQLFERAIELDPEFAAAHAELSSTLWELQKMKGLEQALFVAQKAVALDPSLALAHTRLGYMYVRNRQYEQGIAEAKRAIVLEPNFAEGYARLGEILNLSGKPEEGIGLIEKAMRLNPRYPGEYLYNLGQSYYLLGRDEEAIATLKRASTRNPKSKGPRRHLAVLYVEAGRMDEARAEVAELIKISSKESIEKQRLDCAYIPAALERFLGGLRKAGYPEKSGST